MAKKKDTQEQMVEQNEVAETVEMTKQVAESPEAELPEVKEEKKPTKVQKQEIPAAADKILKMYARYKALYISPIGKVFTADTQPSMVGDAILYQNPYFNK